jgi:hypothetical protein
VGSRRSSTTWSRGISIVSLATGLSRITIRRGLLELKSTNEQLDMQRSRCSGGGRKKIEQKYPHIKKRLNSSSNHDAWRWICQSIRRLSSELKQKNIDMSPNTIWGLLYEMNYS